MYFILLSAGSYSCGAGKGKGRGKGRGEKVHVFEKLPEPAPEHESFAAHTAENEPIAEKEPEAEQESAAENEPPTERESTAENDPAEHDCAGSEKADDSAAGMSQKAHKVRRKLVKPSGKRAILRRMARSRSFSSSEPELPEPAHPKPASRRNRGANRKAAKPEVSSKKRKPEEKVAKDADHDDDAAASKKRVGLR